MAIYENFPYKETVATNSKDGLMSKSDKEKLDSIKVAEIQNISYTIEPGEFYDNNKVKIEVSDITPNSQITVGLNTNEVTTDQYNAAALAKLIPKIADDGIEIECLGVIPEVEIPVIVSIVKTI